MHAITKHTNHMILWHMEQVRAGARTCRTSAFQAKRSRAARHMRRPPPCGLAGLGPSGPSASAASASAGASAAPLSALMFPFSSAAASPSFGRSSDPSLSPLLPAYMPPTQCIKHLCALFSPRSLARPTLLGWAIGHQLLSESFLFFSVSVHVLQKDRGSCVASRILNMIIQR